MKEREKEREGFKLFDDQSAEERFVARSGRLQLGTMHLMALIADRNQAAPNAKELYQSFSDEEVGMLCGNWIKKAKWDTRRRSAQAATRWVKQFMSPLGPFKPQPYAPGTFLIMWRTMEDKDSVWEELSPFIAKWNIPRVEITT